MISIRQIRAARGLLNWSQAQLAAQCGVSATAMNAIDKEYVKPRSSTLRSIEEVLQSHGVEFLDGNGVRLRESVFNITMLEGADAFARYFFDVVDTLRSKGGEALHMVEDEAPYYRKFRSVFFEYYQKIKALGFKERLLIREGVKQYYGPPECSTYRWCSGELASQINISVYGNKYALVLPDKFVIVENAVIADIYRQQFETNWRKAQPVHFSRSLFETDLAKKRSKEASVDTVPIQA